MSTGIGYLRCKTDEYINYIGNDFEKYIIENEDGKYLAGLFLETTNRLIHSNNMCLECRLETMGNQCNGCKKYRVMYEEVDPGIFIFTLL